VKVIVIGCGRVGAALALALDREGWDVVVVDQDEEALERLGDWRKGFVVGHGIDVEVLRRAGIAEADALVAATNGDNTNIVIAQVAQKRFDIQCVVARILDPARAAFYEQQGMQTICPTKTAIDKLMEAVRTCMVPPQPTEPAVRT
jgi:trk system potassium uptake protein TrkA